MTGPIRREPAAGLPLPAPTVLLYNLQPGDRRSRLERRLEQLGIRAIHVDPADYGRPLGALLELPGFPEGPAAPAGPGFAQEMLVAFALGDGMLRDLLAFFRTEGLAPITLKAVVTPTNVQWTSLALHAELEKEHAWFLQNRPRA